MQINLFDGIKQFINNKPIRLIELFGGISAQATALHELGVEFEHYRYVDFDKYAVKSTNAIYGTAWEVTDITKINASDLGVVDTDKYDYIVTYSFPCQDLSVAGKGMGMQKGSDTRSGLLWEVERLLNEMAELPQVLLMENVPQVHGKKNIDSFNEWQRFLESKGYKNYWQDLKATNFGIPQSRNRTFMVSLLGDYRYSFPKEIKLEFLLKDFLETEVDEKYYLSDKMINFFKNNEQKMKEKGNGFRFNVSDGNVVGKTITTNNSSSRMEDKRELVESNNISPTLDTRCDCLGVVEPICLNSKVDGKQPSLQDRVYDSSAVSTAITTSFHPSYKVYARDYKDPKLVQVGNLDIKDLRIRKLTPRECWRLMGFRDELFEKAEQVNSNSQLYKQAGNSIVTTVLMAIFGELLSVEWKGKVENYIEKLKERIENA